jgi:hypothetical protein
MTTVSIITPGIRTKNWDRLIKSVQEPNLNLEFIFIGPNAPNNTNYSQQGIDASFIQDFGSPIRAQQIGLTHCTGDYITWAADDGWFYPGVLTKALEELKASGLPVIASRYVEGGNTSTTNDDYCLLHYHQCTARPGIPKNYKYLNIGLIEREFLLRTGGWDCAFEVCPMSHADLGVRIQNLGVMYNLTSHVMFECEHMPGDSGDHGPVMWAQVLHDEPLFAKYYNEQCTRTAIDINNWTLAPAKWTRRFGT